MVTRHAAAGASRPRRLYAMLLGLALGAALGATLAAGTVAATAASLSVSSSELREFAQRMQLTSAQSGQVNSVTRALVAESNAILEKHGVAVGRCSDRRPGELAGANREINAAYSRARGQLAPVLSPGQLREYGAIYQARRDATKSEILCR